MYKSYSGNDVYTDCSCMFRCLTFHKHGVECYKQPIKLGSLSFIIINYMLPIMKKNGAYWQQHFLFPRCGCGINDSCVRLFEN